MRQDGRPFRVRAIVLRAKEPPQGRAQPHHLEIRPADDAGADRARLAEAEHGELDGGEIAEGADRLDPGFQVAQLGDREVRVGHPDAWRALADIDEPVLIAIDQRPQQHAADDAENGGVGADAQRQREDDGHGEGLRPGTANERRI